MAIDKELKKKVTKDWLNAFPKLSAFAQNKLYKIAGPTIIGIELIKLPYSEEYRPHFVIYSLWKNSIKSCLEYSILMQEFYNNKKLQLNLPYEDISSKYKEAQSIVSNSLKISFEGSISLDRFYALIDDVFQNDIAYKVHSGKIASLFELKFYAALYTGNQIQVENVLNQIQQGSKNWNMQMFETWYGKFDTWLNGLQERVNNREEFLNQIAANKKDKKLEILKSSELTA